jgi:hypothetical protein
VAEPAEVPVTGPARQAQPDTVHADALAVMIASAAPRCRSLAALLRRVPGAYPGDVLATVDWLAANWLLDPATSRRLRTPASPGEENQEDRTLLPDPHPLDYDWRWDPRTVRMLLARCIRATRPGDTIALLGTPTLLAAAAGHHERHWLLLEASEATAAALASTDPARVVRCDLAVDELPLLHAQAVVADPPWYTADTRVFMWAAARLSVPGAVVLLAQPTPATRPGVLDERASILSFAHRTGLDITGLHPAALAYTSPPFERAALDAAGLLPLVPLTWRRGDLIELRRTASPLAARPPAQRSESWREITLDGARIRFRLDVPARDGTPWDPRLVRMVRGDIMPAVSRRDPVRGQVRVWTAGNRVFGCQAPALLACLAATLASEGSPGSTLAAHLGRPPAPAEDSAATEAIRQLGELARAERRTAAMAVAAAIPSAASRTRDLTARSTP